MMTWEANFVQSDDEVYETEDLASFVGMVGRFLGIYCTCRLLENLIYENYRVNLWKTELLISVFTLV